MLACTYGFQTSAIKVQAGNLHAMLRQLRSRKAHASEELAALALQTALLENYRVWCRVQAQEGKRAGIITCSLASLVLMLGWLVFLALEPDWSGIDALYFSVVTSTCVGYGAGKGHESAQGEASDQAVAG